MSSEPAPDVATYRVAVKPWRNGLELHIDGVGVTQSHGIGDAARMALDLIERQPNTAGKPVALEWDLTAVQDPHGPRWRALGTTS